MANITVTIGPTAQGTSVQDQGYWIKKDINAYDYFISQIGRPPSINDIVKFVVEDTVCLIGTLANLSGYYEEADFTGTMVQYYQQPLTSLGAIEFDHRWDGLHDKIYLDNYGIILGKGGDALATLLAPGSLGVNAPNNNFIHWGYNMFYGNKASGNTAIKVGTGVLDTTTTFGVYVRNFGIIAGGGAAGCSVAYEGPPQEVNDSMCAGGGGGAPYGKGGKYVTRPQWNGADASLFNGGAGFNRGTITYYGITYQEAGGNGGGFGLWGQDSVNTHPNAGPSGANYRPYQSPNTGASNMVGFYSEGRVYINNHANSSGVQGILQGRVLQPLNWDETDQPGAIVDRVKLLSAFIRGSSVSASRKFTYKDQIDPGIDTYSLDVIETRYTTFNVLQEIIAKYGNPTRQFVVNLKVWNSISIIGTTTAATTPSIDTGDFPFLGTVNIDNRGYILGRGGDGAWDKGNMNVYPQIYDFQLATNGGPALRIGTNATVIVNNYGLVAGGGGGGGAAGDSASPSCVSGGGGQPFGLAHRSQLNQPNTPATNATLIDIGQGGKLNTWGSNWWYGGNGGANGENGGDGAPGLSTWRIGGLAGYVAVGNTANLTIHNLGSGVTKGRV